MRITCLIWIDEIADKLSWKHNVAEHEVRETFAGSPHFRFVERGSYPGEDLYAVLGRTHAGRYLVVFFIYKKDCSALIISGRDMNDKERKRYGKK